MKDRLPFSVIACIVVFRVLNAISCITFFQPDEYYQTLEIAHQHVFGYGYITWEWRPQSGPIRSPLGPLLFVPVYWFLKVARLDHTSALVWAPKVVQGLVGAMVDVGTYRLARNVQVAPKEALFCSLLSAFNAYVTIRAFTNSIETALTVWALSFWPFQGLVPSSSSFFTSLLLAGYACILRPSNVLLWSFLGLYLLSKQTATQAIRTFSLAFTAVILILLQSAWIETLYFRRYTSTALNFFRYNILDGISSFYGVMSWYFYFVQAIPALMWTLLPFTILGILDSPKNPILQQLRNCTLFIIFVFSLLAHKEARFIQPLLPIFHIFAAPSISSFRLCKRSRLLLIASSFLPVFYLLRYHGSAQISVMRYLNSLPSTRLKSAAFLMPCHSTPWQSHLHIDSGDLQSGRGEGFWFLTCEPPLSLQNRTTYLDQSDVFYADPARYLANQFPSRVDVGFPASPSGTTASDETLSWTHQWPTHLVVFQALLDIEDVGLILQERNYREVWRQWNSHWIDDSRRKGDVVVLAHESVRLKST